MKRILCKQNALKHEYLFEIMSSFNFFLTAEENSRIMQIRLIGSMFFYNEITKHVSVFPIFHHFISRNANRIRLKEFTCRQERDLSSLSTCISRQTFKNKSTDKPCFKYFIKAFS